MDPQFAALADEIYRDKVRRARAMSPEEKLLAGQRLFAAGCDINRAGFPASIRKRMMRKSNEY